MIRNITKKTVISQKESHLITGLQKAKGLMFSIKPKTLIFHFEVSQKILLHMLFVFFSIDLILLDKNKKVIELKENFFPFTFYKSKKKCKYLIELKKGSIKKSKTKLNDIIRF
ncbi:MAG: DUF192 domain-containing protein [Candidatus Woesearchaeota archaeon]